MAKSIPANVNPRILQWAREAARLAPEAAAKAIAVSVEKLLACEAGDEQLTFNQFLAAANAYKRAPALFYLDAPPAGFQPIQDFRRLPDLGEDPLSAPLAWAVRQAHERREVAVELRNDLDDPVKPFALAATLRDDVEKTGQAIRAALGVRKEDQIGWRVKAFDNWRLAIEALDVLVFMVPKIPLAEMRGVAIADASMPVILVNSRDRTNGRTFTLLHEFCHLLLHASGISGFAESDDPQKARVEQFCNAVAAAALVPAGWLLEEPLVRAKGDQKTWAADELTALAARFGISREVALRRLLTLGRTTAAHYESHRRAFVKEYEDLADAKSDGGPARHIVVLSQLGRGFTRLILRGYHDQQLTLRDVANHLNLRAGTVPAIEQAAFGMKA